LSDQSWAKESPLIDQWIESKIQNQELSKHVVKSYRHYLRRLLSGMALTPQEALSQAKQDVNAFWTHAKNSNGLTPVGKHLALMAMKNWVRFHGIYPPADRLKHPKSTRQAGSLSWEEAQAVCNSASKPYNVMLKLMLHCGWGISELLKFNSPETWERVKAYLASNPSQEYFRFNFQDRKTNPQPYFSLIPVTLLKEIVASGVTLPFSTEKGHPFSFEHYNLMVQYLGSAFHTALKRAPIPPTQGHISVHEMRDCFKTRCTLSKVPYEVGEFAIGHILDQRGYEKCYRDEPWMWSELRKVYAGTVVVPETDLWVAMQNAMQKDPEGFKKFVEAVKGIKVSEN